MSDPELTDKPTGLQKAAGGAPAGLEDRARGGRWRRAGLPGLVAAGLLLGFGLPLRDLFVFASHSGLYSYVLLVPVISGYLVWTNRRNLPADFEPAPRLAGGLLGAGIILTAGYWLAVFLGWKPGDNDRLSLLTLAFLFCFWSGCAGLLGRRVFRAIRFPVFFLIFMAPLPSVLENWLQTFLQHGSADAAYALLKLSGTPVLREGTVFLLPGISLEVAPECSGIRSTLVLFITSVLAGHLFLRTRWKAAVLALVVIPLGILRNAFRILTIAMLCVHVGPEMIYSPLHVRGGPIFFVASLVPLFILLGILWKSERKPEGIPAIRDRGGASLRQAGPRRPWPR